MMYGTCNKKALRSKKGFTLVELIVVLAIIGVLSAIAAPTILSKVDEAKKQTDIANAATIAMAVKSEIAEGNIDSTKVTGNLTDDGEIKKLIDAFFDGKTPTCKTDKDANFNVYIENNKITVTAGSHTYYPICDVGSQKDSTVTDENAG